MERNGIAGRQAYHMLWGISLLLSEAEPHSTYASTSTQAKYQVHPLAMPDKLTRQNVVFTIYCEARGIVVGDVIYRSFEPFSLSPPLYL